MWARIASDMVHTSSNESASTIGRNKATDVEVWKVQVSIATASAHHSGLAYIYSKQTDSDAWLVTDIFTTHSTLRNAISLSCAAGADLICYLHPTLLSPPAAEQDTCD